MLTADASRCMPLGCLANTGVQVQLGNQMGVARLKDGLAHQGLAYIPCSDLIADMKGHVKVQCFSGRLAADASGCRPALHDERTAWRLINADPLPSTWRVFEVELYTDEKCESGLLDGVPITSSDDLDRGLVKERAFD